MGTNRPPSWLLALCVGAVVTALAGCSQKKQVPFGLEEPDEAEGTDEPATDEAPTLPVGTTFEPGRVEVPVGEGALVLSSGYALASLEIDLDESEPPEAIVLFAEPGKVSAQAAFQSGLSVTSRPIDSFLVPEGCAEPKAEIRQLSPSLVAARIDHPCEAGVRTNVWILTVEAQPRVRERLTILPPNPVSKAELDVELSVEDRDADGYDDLVARARVDGIEVPIPWLNRPGGFARDPSEPEATFRLLADDAWAFLDEDPAGSEQRARSVLQAFLAMCRESGAARIGLGGAQGVQCGASGAVARAISVAIVGAIRGGMFIEALELQRWWSAGGAQPTPEERELVRDAWQKANARGGASWTIVDQESSTATLYFSDADTLVVDGFAPRAITLSTGQKKGLDRSNVLPPVRSQDGRLAVRGVRVTCAGFEAEVGPTVGKRAHRVVIDRRPGTTPCRVAVDRPASVLEWAVLGWAPQGLLVGSGDRLRVVPVNELGKPAGRAIELEPGSPLPAPIRGARITPDGTRYVIPHPEGVVLRQWRGGGGGQWLRPADWGAVRGELRGLAISPDGQRVAVQKGNEIRIIRW